MKNIGCFFILCFIVVFTKNSAAQVGINTTTPDASAILDLKSSDKGMLVPRMTSTERGLINSPAIGLLVFDTETESFWYWNALTWLEIVNANDLATADTDDQTLSLSGSTLSIDGGNSVDLSSLDTDTDTDDQTIDVLNLNGNTLEISLDSDGEATKTLDLSSLNSVSDVIEDADSDTKIQVEEGTDEDAIRFDIGGAEALVIEQNSAGEPLFTLPVNNSNTFFGFESGELNTPTGSGNGKFNSFFGRSAGASNTSGKINTFLGSQTGASNTSGKENVFVGANAGTDNSTGYGNTFVGTYAGEANSIGSNNTSIGIYAGASNSSGTGNTSVGNNAGATNETGSNNTYLGNKAGLYIEGGSNNLILGGEAGSSIDIADNNTFIGYQAGYNNVSGSQNVLLGYQSGYDELGSNKLYIENSNSSSPLVYGEFDNDLLRVNGELNINNAFSFPTTDGTSGQVLETDGAGNISWASPETASDNQTIDVLNLNGNTLEISLDSDGEATKTLDLSSLNSVSNVLQDADGDTKIQVEEGADEDIIRFDQGGTEYFRMEEGRLGIYNTGRSVIIGEEAGLNDDLSLNANVFIGFQAGRLGTTANNNVAIGNDALEFLTTGDFNVALGDRALHTNKTGEDNTAVGGSALYNLTNGDENVSLGSLSLVNSDTGSYNVAVGHGAGNKSLGDDNVFIGHDAGYYNTGSGNVFIGHDAGKNFTGSNKLYIANSETSDPLIYGEFDNERLYLNGYIYCEKNIKVGSPGDNYWLPGDRGEFGQVLVSSGMDGATYWDDPENHTNTNLSLSGNTLSINGGNSISLSSFKDNTDTQDLSLSGTTLSLTDGGSVSLSGSFIEVGNPDNTEVAGQGVSLDITGTVEANNARIHNNVNITTGGAVNIADGATLKVGSGAALNDIIKVSETRDVGSIGGNDGRTETFTVTGATTGGVAYVSPSASLSGQIVIAQAWVSANDKVSVRFRNTDSGSKNPANMTYYIVVIQ